MSASWGDGEGIRRAQDGVDSPHQQQNLWTTATSQLSLSDIEHCTSQLPRHSSAAPDPAMSTLHSPHPIAGLPTPIDPASRSARISRSSDLPALSSNPSTLSTSADPKTASTPKRKMNGVSFFAHTFLWALMNGPSQNNPVMMQVQMDNMPRMEQYESNATAPEYKIGPDGTAYPQERVPRSVAGEDEKMERLKRAFRFGRSKKEEGR